MTDLWQSTTHILPTSAVKAECAAAHASSDLCSPHNLWLFSSSETSIVLTATITVCSVVFLFDWYWVQIQNRH